MWSIRTFRSFPKRKFSHSVQLEGDFLKKKALFNSVKIDAFENQTTYPPLRGNIFTNLRRPKIFANLWSNYYALRENSFNSNFNSHNLTSSSSELFSKLSISPELYYYSRQSFHDTTAGGNGDQNNNYNNNIKQNIPNSVSHYLKSKSSDEDIDVAKLSDLYESLILGQLEKGRSDLASSLLLEAVELGLGFGFGVPPSLFTKLIRQYALGEQWKQIKDVFEAYLDKCYKGSASGSSTDTKNFSRSKSMRQKGKQKSFVGDKRMGDLTEFPIERSVYTMVMKAYGELGEAENVLETFRLIDSLHPQYLDEADSASHLYSALLRFYARYKCTDSKPNNRNNMENNYEEEEEESGGKLLEIFEMIKKNEVKRTSFMFNVLLDFFAKRSSNGFLRNNKKDYVENRHRLEDLLKEMDEEGVELDEASYGILFNYFGETQHVKQIQLLKDAFLEGKHKPSDVFKLNSDNNIIDADKDELQTYRANKNIMYMDMDLDMDMEMNMDLDSDIDMGMGMEVDNVMGNDDRKFSMSIEPYNILLSLYTNKLYDPNQFEEILETLHQRAIQKNGRTYQIQLAHYLKQRDMRALRECFKECRETQNNRILNVFVANMYLAGICMLGSMTEAERVFEWMIDNDNYSEDIASITTNNDNDNDSIMVTNEEGVEGQRNNNDDNNMKNDSVPMQDMQLGSLVAKLKGYLGTRPNAKTYSLLIRGYARTNDVKGVEKVHERMKMDGNVHPDSHYYSTLINSLIKLSGNKKSRHIHADGELYLANNNNLIMVERILNLFGEAVSRSVQLNEKCYNLLLLVKGKLEGDYEGMEALKTEMEQKGLTASMDTYHALMGSYAQHQRLSDMEKAFKEAVEIHNLVPNAMTYNIMLWGYSKAFQKRLILSSDVSFSSVHYESRTMEGREKTAENDKKSFIQLDLENNINDSAIPLNRCLSLYEEMVFERGIRPTFTTYSIIFKSIGQHFDRFIYEKIRCIELFENMNLLDDNYINSNNKMKEYDDPDETIDVQNDNNIMSMGQETKYLKDMNNKIEIFFSLFDLNTNKVTNNNNNNNNNNENSNVNSRGKYNRATREVLNEISELRESLLMKLELFWKEMISRAEQPNISAPNSMLWALSRLRRFDKVEVVVGELESLRLKADIYTYTLLITISAQVGGQVKYSERFFKEMQRSGLSPDSKLYNKMIAIHLNEGSILRSLQLIKESKANAIQTDPLLVNKVRARFKQINDHIKRLRKALLFSKNSDDVDQIYKWMSVGYLSRKIRNNVNNNSSSNSVGNIKKIHSPYLEVLVTEEHFLTVEKLIKFIANKKKIVNNEKGKICINLPRSNDDNDIKIQNNLKDNVMTITQNNRKMDENKSKVNNNNEDIFLNPEGKETYLSSDSYDNTLIHMNRDLTFEWVCDDLLYYIKETNFLSNEKKWMLIDAMIKGTEKHNIVKNKSKALRSFLDQLEERGITPNPFSYKAIFKSLVFDANWNELIDFFEETLLKNNNKKEKNNAVVNSKRNLNNNYNKNIIMNDNKNRNLINNNKEDEEDDNFNKNNSNNNDSQSVVDCPFFSVLSERDRLWIINNIMRVALRSGQAVKEVEKWLKNMYFVYKVKPDNQSVEILVEAYCNGNTDNSKGEVGLSYDQKSYIQKAIKMLELLTDVSTDGNRIPRTKKMFHIIMKALSDLAYKADDNNNNSSSSNSNANSHDYPKKVDGDADEYIEFVTNSFANMTTLYLRETDQLIIEKLDLVIFSIILRTFNRIIINYFGKNDKNNKDSHDDQLIIMLKTVNSLFFKFLNNKDIDLKADSNNNENNKNKNKLKRYDHVNLDGVCLRELLKFYLNFSAKKCLIKVFGIMRSKGLMEKSMAKRIQFTLLRNKTLGGCNVILLFDDKYNMDMDIDVDLKDFVEYCKMKNMKAHDIINRKVFDY